MVQRSESFAREHLSARHDSPWAIQGRSQHCHVRASRNRLKKRRISRRSPRGVRRRDSSVRIVVEKLSTGAIHKGLAIGSDWRQFQQAFHFDLRAQRSQVAGEIRQALIAASASFAFEDWQRVVQFRHSHAVLSPVGSAINHLGGRFNIGQFAPLDCFPALYLAADRETALLERYGSPDENSPLSALDLALVNPESVAHLRVRGQLASVIDLRNPEGLQPFVEICRGIRPSEHVLSLAKKIRMSAAAITAIDQLMTGLTARHWRGLPATCDVPSTSQVFGQLVCDSGIHGIVFPSSRSGDGRLCLAIYPQNFLGSESFVELADRAPQGARLARLDSTTVSELEMDLAVAIRGPRL